MDLTCREAISASLNPRRRYAAVCQRAPMRWFSRAALLHRAPLRHSRQETIVTVSVAVGAAKPSLAYWVSRNVYSRCAGKLSRWLPGPQVALGGSTNCPSHRSCRAKYLRTLSAFLPAWCRGWPGSRSTVAIHAASSADEPEKAVTHRGRSQGK